MFSEEIHQNFHPQALKTCRGLTLQLLEAVVLSVMWHAGMLGLGDLQALS
jgi:hypothetical protein